MTESSSYASKSESLTKYLFKAPYWPLSLAISVGFSLIVGAGVLRTGSSFSLILDGVYRGFLLIGLPAILSSLLTPYVAEALGGNMTINRSALLSLFSSLIIGLFMVFALFLQYFGYQLIYDSFVMSLGVVFALRFLVLVAISDRRVINSSVPAFLMSFFGAIFLFLFVKELQYYLELLISSIIFGSAFYLITFYMDAPLRKAFGINGLDFLKGFINYQNSGVKELEKIFDEIGEEVKAPIGTIAFKKGEEIKAVIVSPSIHPGPVGELGGGNLPYTLAREIENKFNCTALIAHGAATHDFNLVSSKETSKILDAVYGSIESMEFGGGSESIREKEGDVKILSQRFEGGLLNISTLAPNPSEDIAFPIGYSTILNARLKGAGDLVFMDAHNCYWEELKGVYPGSPTSFDLIDASAKATDKALEKELDGVKVGVSTSKLDFSWEEGFGDLGIRVVLVEVKDQLTAYVFMDGNNMEKGLRERILNVLPVDHGEVLTTDNHVVNMKGDNPVGRNVEFDEIVREVEFLFKEAKEDLEPVEAGVDTRMAEDIEVFGSDMAAQLASTANAIIAMGGGLALAFIVSALALSVLAFLLA
ncbi:MAG: putative membrane associated lipid hydrolase, neutral ceramidase superfamily [Candidatus Methanohalarchaeum thermophilum]|uniref:Membrane associated lipid hydrolase, neutral ceramidase superfamily n=1 Tax=Methanohalarchaeum thermophilum TaxID=1903181 RepID=A0A1Q6DTA7_METT1|nr:MAG: putative membrane associated lipid hydrolase, neutral ceramidase superfamily [Candidatus Methanohalarchaeum thermophilum]